MSNYKVPEPIITPTSTVGEHGQAAVKVIDRRGNDLHVAKKPKEVKG